MATIKLTGYLIFSKTGLLELKKTERFSLAPQERGVRIELLVDEEVFTQPPMPTVRIKVPTEQVIRVVEATTDEPVEQKLEPPCQSEAGFAPEDGKRIERVEQG